MFNDAKSRAEGGPGKPLRIVDGDAPGGAMVDCAKLRLRLLERACARSYANQSKPACIGCAVGQARAQALGIGKTDAHPRGPIRLLRHTKCKRCDTVFASYDGRAHYCPDCSTPKARLKHAVVQACALLQGVGHPANVLHSPNGAVILFQDDDARAEQAIRTLVEAGYGVRVDAAKVGSAMHVHDMLAKARLPHVRIRFGERRTRLRATLPPEPMLALGDLAEQMDLFEDHQEQGG